MSAQVSRTSTLYNTGPGGTTDKYLEEKLAETICSLRTAENAGERDNGDRVYEFWAAHTNPDCRLVVDRIPQRGHDN